MNFTHLVNSEDVQPDQMDLQRYDYFLVLFVLSDSDVDFALTTVGTPLRATSTTLCWVIQPRHLKMALAGTALRDIHDKLKENAIIDTDHSFLAWIAKRDLLVPGAGRYYPLFLGTWESSEKSAVLKDAVKKALSDIESDAQPPNRVWLSALPAIAKLVSQLLGSPSP